VEEQVYSQKAIELVAFRDVKNEAAMWEECLFMKMTQWLSLVLDNP